MFKSQIKGEKKRLKLYSGIPLILGNLEITLGNDVNLSGITTFCGRFSDKRIPKLIIGNNVDIGWQNSFSIGDEIIIEDDVKLAGKVFLAGYPGHPIDMIDRAKNKPDLEEQIGNIVLKKGSWIGTGTTILAGVTIGKGSIIGASSVVTRDIPENVLAAGNPAKVIKKINNRGEV
jgi:acetyltransferase-like isoleucine patch superfamily enzyme